MINPRTYCHQSTTATAIVRVTGYSIYVLLPTTDCHQYVNTTLASAEQLLTVALLTAPHAHEAKPAFHLVGRWVMESVWTVLGVWRSLLLCEGRRRRSAVRVWGWWSCVVGRERGCGERASSLMAADSLWRRRGRRRHAVVNITQYSE